PWELLKPIETGRSQDTEVKGFDASFIHDRYVKEFPEQPEEQKLSWLQWLKKSLPIEEKLYLTSPDKCSLSQTCLYLAKNRPEKFMGFLRRYWETDGAGIMANSDLRS